MTDSNDRRGSGRINAALAATGLFASFLAVGCEVTEPQVLDTHTGDWETVPLPGYETVPTEPQSLFAPYCIPPLDIDADICNSGQALYNEPAGPPEPGQTAVETLEAVGGSN